MRTSARSWDAGIIKAGEGRTTVANEEQLQQLKAGIAIWNAWREVHPEILPDLQGAELQSMDLRDANLREVKLSRAPFRRTYPATHSKATLFSGWMIGWPFPSTPVGEVKRKNEQPGERKQAVRSF